MAETMGKKSKHIFLFLRIAVVVCGIIWGILWLSKGQRWENLTRVFVQMNLLVFVVALVIFVIGQIIVGFRWWLLLRTQSIFIAFWAAVRLHFLGLFYNNFMPSSVGGDLIRAWYVTKHTDKRFQAALSVFVDRAIGLLSTLIIAAFFYMLFLRGRGAIIFSPKQDGPSSSIAEYKWFLFWGTIVAATAICGLLLHQRGRVILTNIRSFIYVHSIRLINRLKDAIVIYCSRPLIISVAFGLTVFLQIMTITGFWFLGVNLGIEASIKYYYVFFTLTWVLGAVPVSIGGAVVVEGLLAYLFIHFAGIEPEPALALALCQRIVWMLASLPGAAIHLIGAHLPGKTTKDFFIDSKTPIN